MKEPIKFNGKQVADVIHTSTMFTPTFKMRIEFLFCRRVHLTEEIGCEKEPGATSAISTVHITSLIDAVKNYWRDKRGYGQMVAPNNDQPCDLQSPE